MDIIAFRTLVTEALDVLPDEFQKILSNVDIVIEEIPTPMQKRKLRLHNGVLLLGLYEGIPQTKRGSNYTMVLPDKITIFKQPIKELYGTDEGIKEHVRRVVLHELGHHFGLSDQQMRKKGI